MTKLIDQSTDATAVHFVKLAGEYQVPDFVLDAATAELTPSEERTGLHIYALPDRKQFPIHNKSAAFVSAMYLDNVEDNHPMVKLAKDRTLLALKAFGAEWPVKKAKAAAEPINPADFLLSIEVDGKMTHRFPVRNGVEVKSAMTYLRDYASEIDRLDRDMTKKIASGVLDKLKNQDILASTLKVMSQDELNSEVARLEIKAGRYFVDRDQVLKVVKRAKDFYSFRKEADVAKLFADLQTKLELEDLTISSETFAPVLDELTKRASLLGQAPIEKITESQLANYTQALLTLSNGTLVKRSSLDILKAADYSELFGIDNAGVLDGTGIWVDKEKALNLVMHATPAQADRLVSVLKAARQDIELEQGNPEHSLTADEWNSLAVV